ncbi:MAG: hypothetical protein AAGA75_04610 [Cyanobacteria bacterium P01_E01_bin.6]
MATALYTHSPAIAKQHVSNMAASLERRIEVARANNDNPLLELLLQEKAELDSLPGQWVYAPQDIFGRVKSFWKQMMQSIENANKLHVEKIVDGSGNTWWYAHDPRTGKTQWAESESEVVKWIEDNNLGIH